MKKRVFAALSCLLAISMVLTACGGVKTGAGGGTGGVDKNQELNMTITAEPASLDPSISPDTVSFRVLNNINEGLFRMNKDNKPEEAIASRVEVSADKKTYTFTLRDAKWSDGKPVTAKDFEYSWKRTLNPKTGSEYSFILFPIKNAKAYNEGKVDADQVGVKAVDDKTLKVELEEPSPYFQGLTTFTVYGPQRKDIVEKYGKKYATEPDKMVTNGPFDLVEWKHEQSLKLKKSDTYWDRGAVKLETANMNIVKDISTGVNLYTSEQTDMTQLNAELADAFKKSPDFTPVTVSESQFIVFNLKNEFLSNSKIRKAISYAIDREALAKLMKDGSKPALALVPPTITGNDNEPFRKKATHGHLFNPREAKRLLKEGMKEEGFTEKPKLTLLSFDDYRKQASVFIQEQLKTNLGLDIQVDPQPRKQKIDREDNSEFELNYTAWNGDYNDPMTFLDLFLDSGVFSTGHWDNKKYKDLVEKAKGNPDFKERTQQLVKSEGILLDDAAIAPVIYGGKAYLQKPYVKEIVRHPIGADMTLKWAYLDGKDK
ncbi:peptide ABC transporter substrate-binding protein [Salinithrix halophila]|uniref:Peptide ABC transporter substrate-binding protein n=1 Tax=Salinithrix halophila TaxID=1485204 RepID=A0ABV8JFH5_9BACL